MSVKFPSSEQFLFAANIIADRFFFSQYADPGIRNILIVKWDEIGDMATATHVFRVVKEQWPDAHVTLLCKPFVKDLVKFDPHIDEILTDIGSYNKRYHLVVELRGTWKTLFRSMWYKARYRTGRAEIRARNKGNQLHEIDTNTAVIESLLKNKLPEKRPELYFSGEDGQIVKDFLERNKIGRFAIFHVGARRKLRQWPLERFAVVAEFLHNTYGLEIIFAGTAEDETQIGKVKELLKFPAFSFTKGYSLSQFSCLCSKASFYLGNESGPLHIAAVYDVPLIGIFGPGVPNVFYPRGKNSKVVHHVLKCNPCNQIDCVEPQNPCINRVTIIEVMEIINVMSTSINLKI